MKDYETLYKILFNGITDAIAYIESNNFGLAKDRLIYVQQEVEDIYINED